MSQLQPNKFAIILPGNAIVVSSNLTYQEYLDNLIEKLKNREHILFSPADDSGTTCIFIPSDNESIIIHVMTEKAWNKLRLEQQYLAQQQQSMGMKV